MSKKLYEVIQEVNKLSDEQIIEQIEKTVAVEKDEKILKQVDKLTEDYCYDRAVCQEAKLDYNKIRESEAWKMTLIAYRMVTENYV